MKSHDFKNVSCPSLRCEVIVTRKLSVRERSQSSQEYSKVFLAYIYLFELKVILKVPELSQRLNLSAFSRAQHSHFDIPYSHPSAFGCRRSLTLICPDSVVFELLGCHFYSTLNDSFSAFQAICLPQCCGNSLAGLSSSSTRANNCRAGSRLAPYQSIPTASHP